MVDFQSRDTRRTIGGEDDDGGEGEEDGEDSAEATGEAGATAPGAEPAGASEVAETAVPDALAVATLVVGPATADRGTVAGVLGRDRVVADETVEASTEAVRAAVGRLAGREDVAAVVTLGGVGVGPGDVTPEAVGPLFDARLDGFGELYRVLSHEQEGTAVVRSRVTAGLVGPTPVCCLLTSVVDPELEALVEDAAGR